MGLDNDWEAPAVQAAIERALRAITVAGNRAGVLALTPHEEERFGAWGTRYFATVSTSLITQALRQAATQARHPDAARLNC